MTTTISNTPLKTGVVNPSYDRSRLKTKIVHLGFGAFHRAHQALFTDEIAGKSESDWGYCEVNLFGGEELIQKLREQDHLYTVAEKGANKIDVKVIGSVVESLHSTFDGTQAILEKMAEPQVAIVSMTITEKGYCSDPATGQLDKTNPLIVHDLANPTDPKSAIGYIVQALRLRRDRGLTPFTVMSCDNVQENGHVARAAVMGYVQLLDQDLAQWIESNVTFPCTMVDRIVPAATEDTLSEIAELLGVTDPCGIACEPFRQWVIEDNFVAGRPDWTLAGAEFVEDVIPFEEMKLRMLNGSHSFLAYLGYLGGYDHISDTMTDPAYKEAALNLMLKEQAPTLTMPEGSNLRAYAELLIDRFTNPSLKHRTWQIAMDGSQKLPPRMLNSIMSHLESGTEYKYLALGVAGWMRYVSGIDENEQPIEVLDPLANELKSICDKHGRNVSVVQALMSIDSIFSPELANNHLFIEEIEKAYSNLITLSAKGAVAAL
ncbi:mannitol dehydrogenase family protein [Vibrio algarum]|uniref:Fructuronate reductase n=1 Tax=Vibrio algarum TaxID=3020714 RepID=A0ABT4YW83_9VIBR|nr:fructuronate reductase [Vibrio sp. KJ40-1]MDB1125847.1 fructuronate reductase [Vibrio sp. KJ40-1]